MRQGVSSQVRESHAAALPSRFSPSSFRSALLAFLMNFGFVDRSSSRTDERAASPEPTGRPNLSVPAAASMALECVSSKTVLAARIASNASARASAGKTSSAAARHAVDTVASAAASRAASKAVTRRARRAAVGGDAARSRSTSASSRRDKKGDGRQENVTTANGEVTRHSTTCSRQRKDSAITRRCTKRQMTNGRDSATLALVTRNLTLDESDSMEAN